MSLIFRLLWIFLTQTRGRRASHLLETQRVSCISLPNDLDLNLHVNNGRLMTYLDFGRIDWLYRTGALQYAFRRGFIPVIGDISVRFLRPLKVFQAFTIESKVLGWGEKWAYFEHRLINRKGQPVLVLVNRGMFWKRGGGYLPVSEVIAAMCCPAGPSPQLPNWVQAWAASLDLLNAATREPAAPPMPESSKPEYADCDLQQLPAQ